MNENYTTIEVPDIGDVDVEVQYRWVDEGIGAYEFWGAKGYDSHIVAEIEDIARFKSYRHLASYAGLVPCLDASADKTRHGRITKQGSPYLRTALVEAAQASTRTNSRVNTFFRRRIVRSGYQKAIVATAHKIIQYAFYILRDQMPYRESIDASA